MLQFHKALHTHKIIVHPRHLPLFRLPRRTCRERDWGGAGGEERGRKRERKVMRIKQALEKKKQEGKKEPDKRDNRLEEVGGERKRNRRG